MTNEVDGEAGRDEEAVGVVRNKGAENRVETLKSWLSFFTVYQGIDRSRRDVLARAALDWLDGQPGDSRLDTLKMLAHAHAGLMAACSTADGRGRDFTSLASKALWLRYPHDVPLYDCFAQEALWMLSKLESNLPAVPTDESRYSAFAHIWRALYDRHASSIDSIDPKG